MAAKKIAKKAAKKVAKKAKLASHAGAHIPNAQALPFQYHELSCSILCLFLRDTVSGLEDAYELRSQPPAYRSLPHSFPCRQ